MHDGYMIVFNHDFILNFNQSISKDAAMSIITFFF